MTKRLAIESRHASHCWESYINQRWFYVRKHSIAHICLNIYFPIAIKQMSYSIDGRSVVFSWHWDKNRITDEDFRRCQWNSTEKRSIVKLYCWLRCCTPPKHYLIRYIFSVFSW